MASIYLDKADQLELVKKFNELLVYAKTNFRYYHNKNADYGRHLAILNDLTTYPVIHRSDLMQSDICQEAIDKNPQTYFETSGTTGNPFPVLASFSSSKNQAFAAGIDAWQSLTKDNVKRAIIALPFEMNPVGLRYFMGLSELGITSIPVGVRTLLCPPEKVIQIMERLKPDLLIGRPLEIMRYAESMMLHGKQPSTLGIRKIVFTGEIVSPNKWKKIEAYYNASVGGVYGLTELDSGGLISCEQHYYHLPPFPYLIVEVLKDDLKTPVNDGELGTIIMTNTDKTFLPIIRYNTGDKGILHKTCQCGLTTPAIQFMGRDSDCIKANGKNIYPVQLENILFKYDVGCDYQILSNRGQISIRLELQDFTQCDYVVNAIKKDILEEYQIDVVIKPYQLGKLAEKLGIAREKAGKLYVLDDVSADKIEDRIKINY